VPEDGAMDRRRRLLVRLQRGHFDNVRFVDFCDLLEAFGSELRRVKGSHHQYHHPALPEVLSVEPRGGQAKPFEIRKMLRLVAHYNLTPR
jgi:predicted RNA binding protein YcfA (HicA-like mRNA interferase family)